MNEGFNEPRTAMWAVAEVCWVDAAGQALRAPATLEDTSASGACVRVNTPISVGANLTIKWHREQFSGIARNCRSDGREFLLGIQRDHSGAVAEKTGARVSTQADAKPNAEAKPASALEQSKEKNAAAKQSSDTAHPRLALPVDTQARKSSDRPSDFSSGHQASDHQEKNVMESKGLLPKFWRRHSESTAPQDQAPSVSSKSPTDERGASHLLSYDDIYHAAGILSLGSGYGIHKVLEMLNSGRIRDLAPEVKRASVMMAIEAAGASVDDVLQDAMRRQHALDTYEAGQQKQIEEFEMRKTKEISQIQAEMERITAHYVERMQRNQDQVAREKEALHNWQMAKQHESQRIAEVLSFCMREPTPATSPVPAAAAARMAAGGVASASSRATALGPSLLPDVTSKA
jgi:hypothetical protein